MRVISIGKTSEGRSIIMAKLSDNLHEKKPVVFIEAGIHAREWISPATAVYLIKALLHSKRI